jgi:hypothetical protein
MERTWVANTLHHHLEVHLTVAAKPEALNHGFQPEDGVEIGNQSDIIHLSTQQPAGFKQEVGA